MNFRRRLLVPLILGLAAAFLAAPGRADLVRVELGKELRKLRSACSAQIKLIHCSC